MIGSLKRDRTSSHSVLSRENVLHCQLEPWQHLAAVQHIIQAKRLYWLARLVDFHLLGLGVNVPQEDASRQTIRYFISDLGWLICRRNNFNSKVGSQRVPRIMRGFRLP